MSHYYAQNYAGGHNVESPAHAQHLHSPSFVLNFPFLYEDCIVELSKEIIAGFTMERLTSSHMPHPLTK